MSPFNSMDLFYGRRVWFFLMAAVASALSVSGCGTTKEARSVMPSGFLVNDSGLRKGVGDEPLLVYGNPTADCRKYDKVIIDPVTLWAKADHSSMQHLSQKDREMLRTVGAGTIRESATKAGLQVVEQPGPDVMRIRAAFTEAEKANVLLEDASIAAPYVSGPATLYAEAEGHGLFTGGEAYEVEFVDSLTGQRLYAAVDKRVGLLDLRNLGPWDPLNAALKTWQERATKRLVACRTTGSFLPKHAEQTLEEEIEGYRP